MKRKRLNYKGESLIINLFGIPGIGKTSAAKEIVNAFKNLGFDCALIPAFYDTFLENSQLERFDASELALKRLVRNFDIIVSDSPLISAALSANESERRYLLKRIGRFNVEHQRFVTEIGFIITCDGPSVEQDEYLDKLRLHICHEIVITSTYKYATEIICDFVARNMASKDLNGQGG
jgi:hypothetical protein